jgi:uncharacterized protein
MVSLAATKIDPFEFARDGRELDGTISLAEFPRLLDVLREFNDELHVRVRGSCDAERRSWLQVVGSGVVILECQRCLERVEFKVAFDSRLQLSASGLDEVSWSADGLDEDDFDIISGSQELLVRDLVEDEVILLLPVSPMHEICALPDSGETSSKPSPFAALAKLKKH